MCTWLFQNPAVTTMPPQSITGSPGANPEDLLVLLRPMALIRLPCTTIRGILDYWLRRRRINPCVDKDKI